MTFKAVGDTKSQFALGQITQHEYNALNQRIKTTYTGFNLLNNPTSMSTISSYQNSHDSNFKGILNPEAFEIASQTLAKNSPRLALSVATHKTKVFTDYLSKSNSSLIFYMPTPSRSPGNSILLPTGIKMKVAHRNMPVYLALGGHSTRFFGLGFGVGGKPKNTNQLFRMDWEVAGKHFPGDGGNLDYWKDNGFEFHGLCCINILQDTDF